MSIVVASASTNSVAYLWLQSQVAKYMHRTDLTDQIPAFIALAENFLFREMNVKEMQVSVNGATTGGYGELPADFGTVSRISITYNNSARTLDYVSLADAPIAINTFPGKYSIELNKLRIWGAGDGQTYTLYYIPEVQSISTVTTNWIYENARDLYLYASCLEAAKYVRNEAEISKLSALVPSLLDSVKRFADRRGQPVTGSLQIKTRR